MVVAAQVVEVVYWDCHPVPLVRPSSVGVLGVAGDTAPHP